MGRLITFAIISLLMIAYIALITMFKKNKLVLNYDKFTKVLSIVVASLVLLLSLLIIITSFISTDIYYPYFIFKEFIFIVLFLFILIYLIYQLILIIRHKQKLFNITNIILLVLLLLFIMFALCAVYVESVVYDEEKEEIIVDDIFYHRSFNMSDVRMVAMYDYLPNIQFPSFAMANGYSFKGLFRMDDKFVFVLDNLTSKSMFGFEANGRLYIIGVPTLEYANELFDKTNEWIIKYNEKVEQESLEYLASKNNGEDIEEIDLNDFVIFE